MKRTVFIKNAAILTATSIILRVLGIVFKVWVAAKVGSEGMGLYSLVLSVYILFTAFASAGLSTAVTRLCANNLCYNKSPAPVIKKAAVLTLIISLVSLGIMAFFCPLLSLAAVGDRSVKYCFLMLSFSLPAVGFSALFKGYFFAVRRVSRSAISQICEQIIRIALSFFLVKKALPFGGAAACFALVSGDTAAEIISFFILYFQFKRINKKLCNNLKAEKSSYRSILRIAFPLTAGRYLSLLLRTGESLLIPRTLKSYGLSLKKGLSFVGSIKAMALPVLLFPSSVLNSVSLLLVPEISSSLARRRLTVVKDITERIIKITSVFSVFFACFFATLGREIADVLYKSSDTGFLLVVLSPIVPLMYLDSVADGILKGLDCQKFTFYVGLTDGVLRVSLIFFLIPRYGVTAFILIMYISNFLTAFLNSFMLIKKSGAQLDPLKAVFMPLCLALIITKSATLLFESIAGYSLVIFIVVCALVSFFAYFISLLLTRSVTKEELLDIVA